MQSFRSSDVQTDPFEQFREWYQHAETCDELAYANAFLLSTIDPEGYPDARVLLLKSYSASGFVFFTNSNSVKGKSLEKLPKAALTFYWDPLGRQIRIQGAAEIVTAEEADEYFACRSRESQIGAWASDQSSELENRAVLENKVLEYQERFKNQVVPRPPHWNGYRVTPRKFEFWQFGANRLHDRFEFRQDETKNWKFVRLSP